MKNIDLSDPETVLKMQMTASILNITVHHLGRVIHTPDMQEIAAAYETVEKIFDFFRRRA